MCDLVQYWKEKLDASHQKGQKVADPSFTLMLVSHWHDMLYDLHGKLLK